MKAIKYTEEVIERAAQEAYENTKASLRNDAVACHTRTKGVAAEVRPQIHFSTTAWAKSQALVQTCDAEIAWHGFVQREGLVFMITDVDVPPQSVTGTSVESDSNDWATWSASLSDDQFNSMRCHMHSHVNMGVFSSAVDDDYQKDMVTKNGGLDYYIFLIFNKRGDIFARVYDVENNIMYENTDIDIVKQTDTTLEWASDIIKQRVTKKTYTARATQNKRSKVTFDYTEKDDYDDEDDFHYFGRFCQY